MPLELAPVKPPGFVDGLRAFTSGVGFIVKTPSTWPFAAVPVLIATALTVALSAGAIHWIPGLIEQAIGASGRLTQALSVVAQVASTLIAILLSVIAALALAQPLGGPALDRLVLAQEGAMGLAPRPEVGFWPTLAASLSSLLLTLVVGLPLLAVLFLISWIFPPAVVVTLPLKVIVTALTLAWDFCDYPLSQRGVLLPTRLAFVRRHFVAIAGFGAALGLAAFIPCGLFFVLPFGVAGAARLVVLLERFDATNASPLPEREVADM